MIKQQVGQESTDLKKVNAELTASLKRCRALLADCRSQLASNANDPPALDSDEQARTG